MKEDTVTLAKKGIIGFLYNYLGKVGSSLFKFLTLIYLIRKLTVSDYGTLNIFINLLFLASAFSSLGTAGVVQRYIPEFYEKNDRKNLRLTIILSALIRLAGLSLIILIFTLFSLHLFRTLNISIKYHSFVPLLCLLIVLAVERELLNEGVLVALLEQRFVNTLLIFYNFIKLLSFVIFIELDFALWGVVLGWTLSEAVTLLACLIKIWRSLSQFPQLPSTSPFPWKRIARYGSLYLLATSSYFFYDIAIDNFIIAHYLGQTRVGEYAFAANTVSAVLQISPAFILLPVLIPITIRQFTKTQAIDSLKNIFRLFNKFTLFATAPLLLGGMLLSDKIIAFVFDPKYLKVQPVLIIIFSFAFFKSLGYSFEPIIKALERIEISLISYLLALFNLLLDLWLIPKIGITGAALATGSVYLLNYLFLATIFRKFLKGSYPWKSFLKISLNLAIMGLVVFLLRNFITNLFTLITVVIIGAAVYLYFSFINKGFSERDREFLNKAIGFKIWVF